MKFTIAVNLTVGEMVDDTRSEQSKSNKRTSRGALGRIVGFVAFIGFVLSTASFVDGLYMGRTAINFVANALASIQGLEDIIPTVTAIVHGLMEWWRENVVQRFFNLFPFEVPLWLHDPISIGFFSASLTLRSRGQLDDHAVAKSPAPRSIADSLGLGLLFVVLGCLIFQIDRLLFLNDTAGDSISAFFALGILSLLGLLIWGAMRWLGHGSRSSWRSSNAKD